jgi:hypothetical protein
VAAVEALLRDPTLDADALARTLGTTVKQLSRVPEIALLRKLGRTQQI